MAGCPPGALEGTAMRDPGFLPPYSDLASPESERNFRDSALNHSHDVVAASGPREVDPVPTDVLGSRDLIDATMMRPGLELLRAAFAVDIEPQVIGGVQTDVVVP